MAQTFTTAAMGNAANDGSGNGLRTGGLKIAADLTELYEDVAALAADVEDIQNHQELPEVFVEERFFYDTSGKGHVLTQNLMYDVNVGPVCYFYEGTYRRFYFAYFEGRKDVTGSVRSGGYENKTWINYYDIDTKTFGVPISLTELYPDSDDVHSIPAIIVADDGRILVFKDDLDFTGAPGIHNAHIEVWKSDTAEDISAFTKVALVGDYTPELAFAYPRVFKLTDGTLFLYVRDKISGEERYHSIMKSEDDGETWTDLEDVEGRTIVADYTTAGWFLYHRFCYATKANGINIIFNPRHATSAQGLKALYFAHSDDGINWENARQYVEGSGGYSHDVITSGNLEKTDLDTNYAVDVSVLGTADTSLNGIKGCIGVDGIPYIIGFQNPANTIPKINKVSNFYLYHYDVTTHAWIKTDILAALARSGSKYNFNNIYGNNGHIVSYGSGKVDIVVNVIEDIYNLMTGETIKATGSTTPGIIYRVVTTEVNHFGTGVVVDDIIRSASAFVCDANNTVVAMKSVPMLFRTEDYGVTFQYVNLDNVYNKHGVGWGTIAANFNFLDSKQMLLMCAVSESTDFETIDHSNMMCFHSKIK
ncbi:MAG: BNR-4 repeat-containing protein [Bacteroidales bacterium]